MAESYLHVHTTKAIWADAAISSYFNLENIDVWRINITTLVPHLSDLQKLLDLQETEKTQRYRQEKDRQSRIIGRAVLKILLGRYLKAEPKEIRFQLDHNKKLLLQNILSENLYFNVSHSGDWILIAVSTNPIGVDAEQINTSFTYQNLLGFSFSLEEKNYIQAAAKPHQSFYKLWTRKEALLKATGKGLIDDLILVPGLDGVHQNPEHITGSAESWQITSFEIDENHLGSAAFMPVKTVLRFFNFQL